MRGYLRWGRLPGGLRGASHSAREAWPQGFPTWPPVPGSGTDRRGPLAGEHRRPGFVGGRCRACWAELAVGGAFCLAFIGWATLTGYRWTGSDDPYER